MNNRFSESFGYKLIYIFRINDKAHNSLLKIGDATIETNDAIDKLPPNCKALNQAAKARINTYTKTAGVEYELLHTELAVRTNIKKGVIEAFRDHDVHAVLKNSRIENKTLNGSREWYVVDLETAKKAIEAVKACSVAISQIDTKSENTPIVFRPEQLEAIKLTLKQFKTSDRMLWNAKMRFGKTLSSLEVIKQSNFKKSIIVTHRPVVDNGWCEDFGKLFFDRLDYEYGSKNNNVTVEQLLENGKSFVYFASIQDLRGSDTVGGKFDKNNAVFDIDWDLIIVDEAHEGTTTALGSDVISALFKENSMYPTKLLELSGTPFNILKNYDDNIYTWDYVMEQKAKAEWDNIHFGDSNPYSDLPKLNIFVYDLGDMLKKKYVEIEDKAFNFKEFFRTWTGDIKKDYKAMPVDAKEGDFVHAGDVMSFLNLITKQDNNTMYPFATKEYRDLFKHSFWMLPGVKEARALSAMLQKHPVFSAFDIVNVAGDGDVEDKTGEALSKVHTAIDNAGDDGYTITLSCGKLTTGVTVKEWTAVFYLAGSFSTSAANYLQTIFRVQSPCNKNGKVKENCYVFDFAPDRTLKMIAESVAISTRAGKTKDSDKMIMGEFLNFCPVIALSGTGMKTYDTNKLLQQLKRAYAERAVQNGFDDNNLYNDELTKLDNLDMEEFIKLKAIVGSSKASEKTKDIDVNSQGLTNEQYEELEKLEKKSKAQRTPDEEKRIEELKEKKKQKQNAISILRGISIRMPLLIYGADVNFDEEFTLDKFLDDKIVDPKSWDEFMPTGVTKTIFKRFMKYYDPEVFVVAGRKIRNTVKGADSLLPTERVQAIANLFACFKNPDKETVLTPWRVVNMHLSDCIGGYSFYEENPPVNAPMIEQPRFVDQGKVTTDTLSNTSAKILEINSKTGLYPLYVTYSIFRSKCDKYKAEELTEELQEKVWLETVKDNIFVICKTPMAKQITKRTLVGYKMAPVNAHYFVDLINMMKNKPENFIAKVKRPSYWDKEGKEMKFDAIVGNPPYHEETTNGGNQGKPIYHYFVQQAQNISSSYISMITPSRWFAGGMGLDAFRLIMINNKNIIKIVDFTNSKDCFSNISISGGVNYFLIGNTDIKECEFTSIINENRNTLIRPLDEYNVLVRYNQAVSILHKINISNNTSLSTYVSSISPYGLSTKIRGKSELSNDYNIKLYASSSISYIKRSDIVKADINLTEYKVMVSQTSAEHAGEPSKDGKFRVLTSTMTVLYPNEACTHSYLTIGAFENNVDANNLLLYLKTKYVRFLILQSMSSIHITKSTFYFVPLQDFTENSDIDWSKSISEIDQQLYKKYNLTEEEIAFIESMIKPME